MTASSLCIATSRAISRSAGWAGTIILQQPTEYAYVPGPQNPTRHDYHWSGHARVIRSWLGFFWPLVSPGHCAGWPDGPTRSPSMATARRPVTTRTTRTTRSSSRSPLLAKLASLPSASKKWPGASASARNYRPPWPAVIAWPRWEPWRPVSPTKSNNPLTTILGYAKLLAEGKDDDHPRSHGARTHRRRSRAHERHHWQSPRLFRAAIAAVRDRPPASPISTRRCATPPILLVPQLRRTRVHLDMQLGDDLPMVGASRHALQQVFVNLVQNAAQAMPQGRYGCDCQRHDTWRYRGRSNCERPGTWHPSGTCEGRIFDPFVTSKEAEAGTGLGLAVCKHLVTSAGGSIDVASGAGGRGARFRLVLPIAQAAAPSKNSRKK